MKAAAFRANRARGQERSSVRMDAPIRPPALANVDDSRSNGGQPDSANPPLRLRLHDLMRRPFDVRSIALTGLFILAIFYTMYFMRSLLLPLVLALLLSYLLRPIVRLAARFHISPPLSAAIILLSFVGLIGYAVSFLAVPAAGWLEKAPYSLQQFQSKLTPLRGPIQNVAKASGEIEKITTPADPQPKLAVEVKRHPIADVLFVRTPELIVSTVMLVILLYFLLAYDGVFLTKLIKLLPRLTDKKRAISIVTEIEANVSRYLLTVTVINIGLGLAVGTAVGLLGLPNPVMWGAMVTILNFVPYLGALTGIICMTLGAVLSFDSFGYALIFPAVYLLFVTLEGNFITPWVMGRSLTLNPVMVLLSLAFWGWMWGIAGIILAVPILAAFKIFCAHIEPIEPIAEFLS
jgi:predicted PurR-regulated permease PerM